MSRRFPIRRHRPVAPLLALVVAGLVTGLLAAEALVRALAEVSPRIQALTYAPRVETDLDRIDELPDLLARSGLGYHPGGVTPGFRLGPGGFRTPPYAAEPDAGVLRMVVLGDSFAFDSSGVPLEEMWHRVAGRRLASGLNREVEVVNLSAPGVGPRWELRLWELEGRHLEPEIVVLGFFVGNDFTDEAGLVAHPLAVGWSHSRLARLVRNTVVLARERARRRAHEDGAATGSDRRDSPPPVGLLPGTELPGYAELYDPRRPTFSAETHRRIQWQRLALLLPEPLLPDGAHRFDELARELRPVLERWIASVRATGAKPAILLIPDENQVNDALRRRLLVAHGTPPGAADVERPQRWLMALCRERCVPCLDTLPLLRNHPDRDHLYRPRDTHWTDLGNRAAGEALGDLLVAVTQREEGPCPGEARGAEAEEGS